MSLDIMEATKVVLVLMLLPHQPAAFLLDFHNGLSVLRLNIVAKFPYLGEKLGK